SIDDALRAASQVDIEALREQGEEDIVEALKKESRGSRHLHDHGEEQDADLLVMRAETLRL
ncbi:MAG: hypothetical protein GWN18_17725, partial [Thermoplasmata archaeon]|nr:hypothetical protein [Thermoplasmata archaeon]NIS13963.1 hypothetical protein [Thermoplasmata archaeon]NIS21800.1 hypothetical protein [Thermoplasmata archaeon]NIT79404.1 hypothetical protein [Thermoplasmata archaeon]NIU50833.1 hypothetical protein [Thermoplasmata archaeon]